jgi:hypothetical protein
LILWGLCFILSFDSEQVTMAQKQLYEILLINPDADREAVIATLNLCVLQDDPGIDEPG